METLHQEADRAAAVPDDIENTLPEKKKVLDILN